MQQLKATENRIKKTLVTVFLNSPSKNKLSVRKYTTQKYFKKGLAHVREAQPEGLGIVPESYLGPKVRPFAIAPLHRGLNCQAVGP